ncbi:MAG TPA: hypothetical protein VIE43_20065 [Thermoanaerobaculia bacterium]|nr:hypothetical protein [Thermoanaerobaculia bacterium]
MTHNEYEQSKRRLEEARRAGAELVEAAYQAQMRALEMVWRLQGGILEGTPSLPVPAVAAAAPVAPQPPAPPERSRKRSFDDVDTDVRAHLSRLPESFTRRDVCRILGYEPERGALYRCLKTLTREARLRIEEKGEGQRATVYRRTGGGSPPA